MRKLIQFFFVISIAVLFTGQTHAAAEYKYNELGEIVNTLYRAGNFSELDKLATEFRLKKYRNSSGNWHLTIFYIELSKAMAAECKDGTDAQWGKVESKINRWKAVTPQSVAAPIALAIAQRKRAWAHRGTGLSKTVTAQAWEGYNKHLAAAHRTLATNKKLSSVDPNWYAEMLTIAYAQGWDGKHHRALYEEALAKEPLYYHTYTNALIYLTPRWGGSMASVHSFIEDAVTRTSSSEGKAMYARLYADFANLNGGGFLREPVVGLTYWEKIKAGYKDLLQHYPNEWNRNMYAQLACAREDFDVFITMAREFGGKPMPEVWDGDYFERCKGYAKQVRPNSPI